VALRGEFAHAGGRQPDPVFVVLDFLGYADEHGRLLLLVVRYCAQRRPVWPTDLMN
jgi:hypothetical protein